MAQTADSAVLAAGLQAQDAQSLGNDHLLLLVVRGRDTLEHLEALQGGSTTGGLVGNHAADGLVEDARGGAEVEGTCRREESDMCVRASRTCEIEEADRGWLTTAGGVVTGHLAQVGVVLDCIAGVSSGSPFT